ncbi:MAG: dephospho-CoA kinase [Akkermansiaceae bacterium]
MNNGLHVFAVTGGIATGKSTFCKLLQKFLPEAVVFDADACVKDLYQRSDIKSALSKHFGSSIINGEGVVDKVALRQRVFADASDKAFLESIFHPKVREECLALLAQTHKVGASRVFVAEVPLLFENGFDFGQSANLLVATSKETQIQRLKKRNAWDDDAVTAALAAQLPISEKLAMADVVFWNEGRTLAQQCQRFLRTLTE